MDSTVSLSLLGLTAGGLGAMKGWDLAPAPYFWEGWGKTLCSCRRHTPKTHLLKNCGEPGDLLHRLCPFVGPQANPFWFLKMAFLAELEEGTLLRALMMAVWPQPKRSLISILTWLMLCQSIDLVILTLDCVCLASRTGTLSSGEVKLPAQPSPAQPSLSRQEGPRWQAHAT